MNLNDEYPRFKTMVQTILEQHPTANFVIIRNEQGQVIDIEVSVNDDLR